MIPARSATLPNARPEPEVETAGLLREIGLFIRQFIVAAFDPYRPERHYMRGPGPACKARDLGL